MARRVWENLGTFVLAMILAILVWVVALNEENPIEEGIFSQSVAVRLRNAPTNMILIDPGASQATVTIRAPRQVWQTLTEQQISVVADLGQRGPGTYTVTLQAEVNADSSKVVSIDPPEITVVFEREETRACPVTLTRTGTAALGYEAAPAVLTPNQINIEGPASTVARVADCVARVTTDGLRETFTGQVSVIPVDENGNLVTGVVLSPNNVQVSIPVSQKQGFRDVAVKVVITGQLASGYQVTNIAVTPRVLTLSSSDPSVVEQLPGFIETTPLDISGASSDVVRRVALQLLPGVEVQVPPGVESGESVLVEVSVAAIEYSLTVQRELDVRGLAPGLGATLSPDTVDVLILGPLPVLDNLTPEDVRVVLDLTGLRAGTYHLTPQVVLLSDRLRYENVLPSQIEVIIAPATPTPTGGTPTPTPTDTPTITPTNTRPRPTFTASNTPTPTPQPTTGSETPTPTDTPPDGSPPTETATPSPQ
jgi:YbbR domain-containing protein